jgi:hypothetical protein
VKDPIGRIVQEIRAGLQADGGTWPVQVRGGRRMEGNDTTPGDGPPLVIVRGNTRTRDRTDAARWRLAIISYDTDPRLAMLLDERVSDVLHNAGPRFLLGGVGIYRSNEETGGQPGEDPDTRWSTATSVYIVHASTTNP